MRICLGSGWQLGYVGFWQETAILVNTHQPINRSMLFISLIRFKEKVTKAEVEAMDKMFEMQLKAGIKNIGVYWTLGRIDVIRIFEAQDEFSVMQALATNPSSITTETLVAVSKDEAVKLLEF